MKYSFYILLFCSLFTACKQSNQEIKERIITADSVAVNFFPGDGSMDTVIAVKIIRDKQQITKLATLISDEKTPRDFKCGYDGSLHFFKLNKVIQDVDFRMDDNNCMYFSFLQQGRHEATRLSSEAKELISSFRK
jgi:hypothetical protein